MSQAGRAREVWKIRVEIYSFLWANPIKNRRQKRCHEYLSLKLHNAMGIEIFYENKEHSAFGVSPGGPGAYDELLVDARPREPATPLTSHRASIIFEVESTEVSREVR